MGMLKRIDVSDLRLGMYIHKLEGNWLKHPFWRAKFVITDSDLLEELQASEVEGVVIDVGKGDDVATAGGLARRRTLVSNHSIANRPGAARPIPAPRDTQIQMPASAPRPGKFDPRSTAPQSFAQESLYAAQQVSRWQRSISGMLHQIRLGRAITADQVEPMVDELFSSIKRNPHALNGLMRVRRENSALYDSLLAVSGLMLALGNTMKLPEAQVKEAGMTGLLMNVGMGYLPIDVSTIKADLAPAEHEIVKTHAQLGFDFLSAGGEIPEAVLRGCLEHHERMDGSGYPMGLPGDEISLLGRMAGVCDMYNSLTSDRPHRERLDPSRAMTRMQDMAHLFDKDILAHFIESLGVYPIGSVVKLQSGWLALVIDQNDRNFSRPRVWIFFDLSTNSLAKPKESNLGDPDNHDSIVSAADPANYGLNDFAHLREMLFNSACKAMKDS